MVENTGDAFLRSSLPAALGQIHGIVLAGAYPRGGSGLDSLRPRPLLPVAERPLFAYGLGWMRSAGLSSATVCTNVATRAGHAALGGSVGLSLDVDYLEDWTPRGPGGCVHDAGVRTNADTFVVVDGTTVPLTDLPVLLEAHEASKAAVTVVVRSPSAAGRAAPARSLEPVGIYVFARRVLDHLPGGGFQDIKETLIPRLYRHGEHVGTYAVSDTSPRVVSMETYLALNQWVLERLSRLGSLSPGFRRSGDVVVHDTASIAPSARLIGPVVLGRNCSVHARATVVGPAIIGAGSLVDQDAVVSRSVLWSGCVVHEGAVMDRCVAADAAVAPAGQSLVCTLKRADPHLEAHRQQPPDGGRLPWWLGRAGLRAPSRPAGHRL
jgi:mannose-1-phosphate guanylyltransferase